MNGLCPKKVLNHKTMKAEVAAAIDQIEVNMNASGMNTINIILAFVMFGVALGIRPSSFIEVFRKPKSVILGAICQLFLLPAMTFVLCVLMREWISPMIGLGMILVSACPGGNISNFMTSLSKGNLSLSVSLTAVSTSASIFATPINFTFWGNCYLQFVENHFTINTIPELQISFWEVFRAIVLLLGIPFILGMLCSHYFPKFSNKSKKIFQYLSVAFFILIVILSIYQNIDALGKCIKFIFLIVLIHNLLALGIGFSTGTLFKVPYKDRRTLTIETGIQNSGLGLVLLFNPNIFDPTIWANNGGMLVITAWWGIWHIISGLTVSYLFNRSKHPDEQN